MGWKPDPIAGTMLAVMLAVYGTGTLRAWRAAGWGRGVRVWEAGLFAAGWLTLAFAVLSPLATWAEALFWVHMTQHELLVVVVAPLIVAARPITALAWSVPRSSRVGQQSLRTINALFLMVSAPLVAFTLHAVALWTWHLPVLYERAIGNNWIHALEHASFLMTACAFWAGLTQGRYGRLGYGVAFVYVFATALHSGALGALFTVAPSPLYHLYELRAAAHGVNPLTDQQLAGVLMWVPACALLTVLALALFAAWLGELERRNAQSRLSAFTHERQSAGSLPNAPDTF
jgi:putative membrane protein